MQRIEIEEIAYGGRGPLYRVWHAGEVLLDAARVPALDAARALLAKGIVGRMEAWHVGAAFPAMVCDIEKAAQLTVKESATESVRFAKWEPVDQEALLRRRVEAPEGVSEVVATQVA